MLCNVNVLLRYFHVILHCVNFLLRYVLLYVNVLLRCFNVLLRYFDVMLC